ncbi:MAG: glycoside hydrolase family 5 protein [Ruminococcus sp.]
MMRTTKHCVRMAALLLAGLLILTGTACGSTATSGRSDTMEDMDSQTLVSDMGVGWNLGDTLDVCAADRDGDGKVNEAPAEGEKVDETLWGNVYTTPELFDHLKADGVKSVRIPVTWRDHISDDGKNTIDPDWMQRVQEIVDYAYDRDMYVILNIHHDGGGDPDFGAWIRTDAPGFEAVREKYKRVWEQIAAYFSGYDERLIFESMNEVGFDSVAKARAYDMLNTLNQDFVDLVRASGGNNDKRHLLIAGYWTDIEMTCDEKFRMPDDPAGHCIVSVHYYTPYQFCITGEESTWGTDGDIKRMQGLIQKMEDNFVSQGVPVIVGEYGMVSTDTNSRILFSATLTQMCHERGMATFFWDNGSEYDREAYQWRTEGLIEALCEAVQ